MSGIRYYATRCLETVKSCARVLLTFKAKIVFFGGTGNVNLGDNAQRFLIRKWCQENFQTLQYVEIPLLDTACEPNDCTHFVINGLLSGALFLALRITQRKGDVFVTNSGYGLIDHSWSWLAYARLAVACKRTPILMMPQTINFMNPWVGEKAARAFNGHGKIFMLARDFVSLDKARSAFSSCHPMAFPDVVTSMIGTRVYAKSREGVLFCVRDDGEAYYERSEIKALESRFGCRVEEKDTTLKISSTDMDKNRERYISEFIEYVAGFKAVITDRYHGTIFSMIANTPVVVISSTDHKLSSGVKWFPPEVFGKNIQFAETLDKAYEIANEYLNRTEFPALPAYFKDNYWDKLKGIVESKFSQ